MRRTLLLLLLEFGVVDNARTPLLLSSGSSDSEIACMAWETCSSGGNVIFRCRCVEDLEGEDMVVGNLELSASLA